MQRTETSVHVLMQCRGRLTPRALTFRSSTMSKPQALPWTRTWISARVKGARLSRVALATLAWCIVRRLLSMLYDSKPNGVGRTRQQRRVIPARCPGSLSNRYHHRLQTIHHLQLIICNTLTPVISSPLIYVICSISAFCSYRRSQFDDGIR